MKEHHLKCWPEWFGDLWDGVRPFEIRRDDRGYKVGDQLVIEEWDPDLETYTGRAVRRTIGYIFGYHHPGLSPMYAVLSFANLTDAVRRIGTGAASIVVGTGRRRVSSSVEGVLEMVSRKGHLIHSGLREYGTDRYVRCVLVEERWRDQLLNRQL